MAQCILFMHHAFRQRSCYALQDKIPGHIQTMRILLALFQSSPQYIHENIFYFAVRQLPRPCSKQTAHLFLVNNECISCSNFSIFFLIICSLPRHTVPTMCPEHRSRHITSSPESSAECRLPGTLCDSYCFFTAFSSNVAPSSSTSGHPGKSSRVRIEIGSPGNPLYFLNLLFISCCKDYFHHVPMFTYSYRDFLSTIIEVFRL